VAIGAGAQWGIVPHDELPDTVPIMRVMVTGGTGFVGSHTVRAFVEAGHSVRLLVRDREKVKRVFDPVGIAIPDGDVVVGDITDEARVDEAFVGCDSVFHCAALVEMRRKYAQQVLDTNARGVDLVIGGAVRRGLGSIVYVSSSSIFFYPGAPPLHLDMPLAQASTAYAQSKADAERLVRRLQDEGAPIRVSYPTGVVGPDDPGLSDANHALRSFYVETGIDTSGFFQIVDVRDLAALHLRQLELPGTAHRHVAAGPCLTWHETYSLLDELTGGRVRQFPCNGRLLRAFGSVGDVVKRVWDFNFPLTRDAMEYATLWPGVDGAATTRELGVEFRSAAETYGDTLRWMHREGHLESKHVGRLLEG
jgi:nucleoside-diphosphate-sugar epimerase